MRSEVLAIFLLVTKHFEGSCKYMYLDKHLDKHGVLDPLVTTALGNLLDPVERAHEYPWVHRYTGVPATRDEVNTEWTRVKSMTHLALDGGSAFAESARLVLTPDAEKSLFYATLHSFDQILATRFSQWETWPAEAQLATLSLSWAVGPNFEHLFPRLESALQRMDFETAAREVKMRTYENECLERRNDMNRELFLMADSVMVNGLDRSIFHMPLPGQATSV